MDNNQYLKLGYKMDNGNIVTPEFRASYVFLNSPRIGKKGKNPKYCVNCVFPVGTDLTILKQAALACVIKQFGQDQSAWPKFKNPFKPQDDRVGKDKGYEKGGIYIIPNSNNKPGIVDAAVKPIINPSDIYGGCWGVAMVRVYWYDNDQKGVGFELINFQKTRDGEPLGVGRSTPESGFQAVGSSEDSTNGFTPQSSGVVGDPFGNMGMGQGAATGAPSDIFK